MYTLKAIFIARKSTQMLLSRTLNLAIISDGGVQKPPGRSPKIQILAKTDGMSALFRTPLSPLSIFFPFRSLLLLFPPLSIPIYPLSSTFPLSFRFSSLFFLFFTVPIPFFSFPFLLFPSFITSLPLLFRFPSPPNSIYTDRGDIWRETADHAKFHLRRCKAVVTVPSASIISPFSYDLPTSQTATVKRVYRRQRLTRIFKRLSLIIHHAVGYTVKFKSLPSAVS